MANPMIKDYFAAEFIKFFVCNGFAAVVNFSSRIVINMFWGSYYGAVSVAYFIGMVTAFTLNKLLVFKGSEYKTWRQFFGFTVVNIAAILQTLLFSWLFREMIFPAVGWTFYPDEIAHLIGIGIPVFTSFLGHKYFSFGGGKDD